MPLSSGFELPIEGLVVVTEEEIFGRREKTRRSSTRWPDGAAVEALGQEGQHLQPDQQHRHRDGDEGRKDDGAHVAARQPGPDPEGADLDPRRVRFELQ